MGAKGSFATTCSECGERPVKKEGRGTLCGKCTYRRYATDTCECGARKKRSSPQCRSCAARSGDGHNRWKGGRKLSSQGYVLVYTTERHEQSGTAVYKFEHVLVMEEALGRELREGENVHHLNGVKDDNRIENLELWLTNQPKGQRIPDLLEWAREIIANYEEEETP